MGLRRPSIADEVIRLSSDYHGLEHFQWGGGFAVAGHHHDMGWRGREEISQLHFGIQAFEHLLGEIMHDTEHHHLYQQQLQQSVARLQLANRTDGLTGVLNRSYWQQQLSYEIQRAERYQHPLSLLLFDLDKFKPVNDEAGHKAGFTSLL